MTGTLYGVGVGPGDPELMTLKAWRLIRAARVVAYPAPGHGDSFARAIAAEAIAPEAEEIAIRIPMRAERFPAKAVYAEAAARIGARLEAGEDVVVLCEGDPFFYGSFMYLFERLSEKFPAEIIPGVGSFMACAAALKRPIVAREDVLTILPATLPDAALREKLAASDAAALMKLGRHFPRVRSLLGEMGLTDRAGYVAHASLPRQIAVPLAEAPEAAPYFSMILVYKGAEPWTLPSSSPSTPLA